jgi:hypothetical protein
VTGRLELKLRPSFRLWPASVDPRGNLFRLAGPSTARGTNPISGIQAAGPPIKEKRKIVKIWALHETAGDRCPKGLPRSSPTCAKSEPWGGGSLADIWSWLMDLHTWLLGAMQGHMATPANHACVSKPCSCKLRGCLPEFAMAPRIQAAIRTSSSACLRWGSFQVRYAQSGIMLRFVPQARAIARSRVASPSNAHVSALGLQRERAAAVLGLRLDPMAARSTRSRQSHKSEQWCDAVLYPSPP